MRDVCAFERHDEEHRCQHDHKHHNGQEEQRELNEFAPGFVQLDNRVRTLGMVISSSTFNLVDHCDYPQYANGQEREEIQQQIPAAIAWRSGFDRR